MTRSFSNTSLQRLYTCHPKLVTLFKCVLNEADCSIICGHRSALEQQRAFDEGKSKLVYPASKHNSFPSRAVDVAPYDPKVPGGIAWEDVDRFKKFAEVVKKQADCIGVKVVWGGDWQNFVDYPHWELHSDEV